MTSIATTFRVLYRWHGNLFASLLCQGRKCKGMHGKLIKAGPSGREVSGVYNFGPLEHWDFVFEPRLRYGFMSAFFCVVLSFVSTGFASGVQYPVQGVSKNV
jgi:hypothetical protein